MQIHSYKQSATEQDAIVKDFFFKVAGSRGRKLSMDASGGFLDKHNADNLRKYLEDYCTDAQGVTDVSLANMMAWVHKEKMNLHWDIAPTGLVSRKPESAQPEAPKKLTVIEEYEIKDTMAVYAWCAQRAYQNFGGSHASNARRRQEIKDIVNSYAGKKTMADALACKNKIMQLESSWA